MSDVVALREAEGAGVDHDLQFAVVDAALEVGWGGVDEGVHVAGAGGEAVVDLEEEVDAVLAVVLVDRLPEASGVAGIDGEVRDGAVGAALVTVLAASRVVHGHRSDLVPVEVSERAPVDALAIPVPRQTGRGSLTP
ncbi:hypothetical protein [Streptomyces sp. NPDC096033]|uniref:hypothetical protein n=1 Tax=Streptomyces sp. NPDC096033 TaxID=3366071 RepID=UPI00382E5236